MFEPRQVSLQAFRRQTSLNVLNR